MENINTFNNQNQEEREFLYEKLPINNYNFDQNYMSNELLRLNKIIEDKDKLILELHNKIKDFKNDIKQLKNQIIFISELSKTKPLLKSQQEFQIQIVHRFQIFPQILNFSNNLYNNNHIITEEDLCDKYKFEDINKDFNEIYDNNILKLNSIQNFDKNKNINNELNNNDNSTFRMIPYQPFDYEQSDNKSLAKISSFEEINLGKSEENKKSSNVENVDENINNVKYNSSLFFHRCKMMMKQDEYFEFLKIIKMSNSGILNKDQTFLKITDFLDNTYPELCTEFKSLFY